MDDDLQEIYNLFHFVCPHCNKVFKHKSSKSRHMKNCALSPYKSSKRKADEYLDMTDPSQQFKTYVHHVFYVSSFFNLLVFFIACQKLMKNTRI